MKVGLFLCLKVIFLVLLTSCEPTAEPLAENSHGSPTANTDTAASNRDLREKNSELKVLDYYDVIAARSSIKSLRNEQVANDGTEVRIWVEAGSNRNLGLILKRGARNEAEYLPSFVDDEKPPKIVRLVPKVSWQIIWDGIDASKLLDLRDEIETGRVEPFDDSDLIVVESRRGDDYRYYMYGAPCNSNVSDAKTMLDAIQNIGTELGIDFYHCAQ